MISLFPRISRITVMFLAASAIWLTSAFADPSPTGRNPTLIWTPARQAIYNRMWADYQASPSAPKTLGGQWMKQTVDSAANNGAPLTGAGVMVFLYQVTGNVTYAQQAYNRFLLEFPASVNDANFVREAFIRFVVYYDWLLPGLTQSQRDVYLGKLNAIATYVSTHDLRLDDSDQTTGTYFGLVLLYLTTGSYNPTAVALYNQPWVGGLDATGTTRNTARNAVKDYIVNLAAGGEWFESSEYNLGTTRLLMEGAEAIHTHTGTDHFPEFTAWLQDWALRAIYMTTPDMNQTYQWGDEENPRALRVWDYVWNAGTIAGLTDGTPNGPYIQDRLLDSVAKWPLTTYNNIDTAIMLVPGMMFVNPYATRGDTTTLPKSKYMPGQGFLFYHDGWDAADSFVGLHLLPNHHFVDHTPQFFGDVQMYRKGEWTLTHPISYAGPPTNLGDGVNGMKFYDLFSMTEEYKKVRAQQVGTNPDFAYLSGTMGGQIAGAGTYDPPPTWLMEATRSYLYLPSPNKASDTLVIFDRFNALRPQDLSGFSGGFNFYYTPALQTAISGNPRRQVIFHMPVNPTVGSEVTWATPGGQQVVLSPLLPAGATRTVIDENNIYQNSVPAGERKFQLRLSDTGGTQWQTFLNVLTVHDGIARSNTLIQSTTRDIQGVNVHRAGLNDTVALFNARQGPNLASNTLDGSMRSVFPASNQTLLDRVRLLTSGYTVTLTTTTATADVFLMDLDPAGRWTVAVDTQGDVPLTPSSAGVGRLTISGSGSHTIRVTGAGGAETAPQAPTGVRLTQ